MAVDRPTERAVRTLGPGDRPGAVATLTLAFASDPVIRWVLADGDAYLDTWPQFIDAFAGSAFDHGGAQAVEHWAGVALWLPPGVASDGQRMEALMSEAASADAALDLDGVFEQMDHVHPTFDHWYLPLAGVDPMAQGRGLGSALLAYALERIDRDGQPAYLEATSERNRALYERHGFERIGMIQHGGSPPMWPMLRRPT
jgi:ribosomal protein S18 acetylase RimI-like enzyme